MLNSTPMPRKYTSQKTLLAETQAASTSLPNLPTITVSARPMSIMPNCPRMIGKARWSACLISRLYVRKNVNKPAKVAA